MIGSDAWIESGATILKGVKVADHGVIAAGAIVPKDIGSIHSIWELLFE